MGILDNRREGYLIITHRGLTIQIRVSESKMNQTILIHYRTSYSIWNKMDVREVFIMIGLIM